MNIEKMMSKFEAGFSKIKSNNVKVEIKQDKQETKKEVKQIEKVIDKNNFDLSKPIQNIKKSQIENNNTTLIVQAKNKIDSLTDTEKQELKNNPVNIMPIINIDNSTNKVINRIENIKPIFQVNNVDNIDNITINLNNDLQGIEIKFKDKPEDKIIQELKSNGFKWHSKKFLWYSKQSEEKLNFAYSLITIEVLKVQEELIIENGKNEKSNFVHNRIMQHEPQKKEIEPLQTIDTLDNNIFINALVPSINKNNTKEENDQEIENNSYLKTYQIVTMVILLNEDYNTFCNNFLTDYEFLKGNRNNEQCICVMCKDKEPLIVDTSGYSYARYVCRLVEEVDQSIEKAMAI